MIRLKPAAAAALLVCLPLFLATGSLHADYNDFSQGRITNRDAMPSPNLQGEALNDYTHRKDILYLDPDSGNTVIYRTDQKIGMNQFIPYLIPIVNLDEAGVRELRPVARRICGLEGGYAQIVIDEVTNERFVQITCTPNQLPFVDQAITALDKPWVNSTDNGEGKAIYKAYFRDIKVIDNLAKKYTGGSSQLDKEDNAVVHVNTVSQTARYLQAAREIDIPVHEITIDAQFYEVNTNNDQKIGLDYIQWKNDAFDLFFFGSNSVKPSGEDIIRGHYYGYNAFVASKYYDFLQTKGVAKVLANASIQTVSGRRGIWESWDPIQSISTSGANTGGVRPIVTPARMLDAKGRPNLSDPAFDREGLIDFITENLLTFSDGIYKSTYPESRLSAYSNESLAALLDNAQDTKSQHVFTEDEVTAVLVSLSPDSSGSVTFNTSYDRFLNFRNFGRVGLSLTVLPVVGTKCTEMYIAAQSNTLGGYTPQGVPRVTESIVTTTVQVRDGEQLILAGLTRNEKVAQKAGMPFFGDLPVVGYLFGGETQFDRVKKIVIVLDTTISAGMVDAEDGHPLTIEEVNDYKTQGLFGRLRPESMALPASVSRVKDQAAGLAPLEIPANPFGFDQWLLDPEQQIGLSPEEPDAEDSDTTPSTSPPPIEGSVSDTAIDLTTDNGREMLDDAQCRWYWKRNIEMTQSSPAKSKAVPEEDCDDDLTTLGARPSWHRQK